MTLKRVRFVQRRKAVGHTQEELAARLGVERSTVVRWEQAETEPQPWLRPKIARVLRVTPEELAELLAEVSDVPTRRDGYVLVTSVPLDFSLTTAHTVRVMEGFTAHDMVSRRQVLQQLTVLTSAALLRPIRNWVASLPVVPVGGAEVGLEDIAELEQAVTVWRRWDASGAGGLRRKAVVGQLNEVAESLNEMHASPVARRLFSVTAELAQLAGWMSYDQGLAGAAQRYYLLALHACREAAAPALGAKVIGDMAQLSTALGNYDDSLNLVRTGLYSLPRHRDAPLRSELLGLESRAYAQLGSRETSNAVRSVEACVEAWHEAPAEPEAAPDWMHYMNQAEVDCLAANTYIELALHTDEPSRRQRYGERAERHTMSARRGRGEGYTRSRILDEIRLAKVRLAQREPAESATVAMSSLGLAASTHSSLVRDRLIRFHRELAVRHAAVSEVADFHAQLREYLRKVAPMREAEVVAGAEH